MNRPLAALVVALLTSACGGATARPNVVLVVIDTLRADRLGCYGNPRGLTPYIDDFARAGVVFEDAHAHAPWTLPSTASLLTSLHPAEHGAGGKLGTFHALGEGVETVAATFGARGYATHAIVNVAFLDEETFGVTRDFDSVDKLYYENNRDVRTAEATSDAALAWMAAQDGPYFLLVHYFDPHTLYAPPQPFRRRFARPRDQEDESFVFGTRQDMENIRFRGQPLVPSVIERAAALYDGEVAFTDAQVGRLLDGLDTESVVVLTSDHGEEFLDHGGFEHGHSLHSELTHIPLIVRAPGLGSGRVASTVRHIDVAPTLCELADVPAPVAFVGRSLVPLVGDVAARPRPVYSHGNMWSEPLQSWRAGAWTLILPASGPASLYRAADPRDVAAEEPQQVAALTRALEQHRDGMAALRTGRTAELSAEVRAFLEGNGYVGGDEDGDDDDQ
jgi:arylsulfatase A-like enzyme